jgi:hypothetical protein
MAFGFGFGMPRSFAVPPFSPASLFANGEQGWWYDPSNYGPTGTLFQDSAGTTPVTAMEQPVGLQLDLSKGLVLGPELVVNGDFSNGTTGWSTWNTNAQISVASGQMTVTQPVGGNQVGVGNTVAYTTVVGRSYVVSLDVILVVGSTPPQIRIGDFNGSASINGLLSAGTGRRYFYFRANTTSTFVNVATSALAGDLVTFDNISVRELPGNHRFQTTSANRPVVSARVNLLTKTEEFNDAAWTKSQATVTANATTAPNGTLTADKMIEASGSVSPLIYPSVGTLPAAVYVQSVYAKAAERSVFTLSFNNQLTNGKCVFDLSAGTFTLTTGSRVASASIEAAENGWYRCVITSNSISGLLPLLLIGDGSTYTGNGTSGVFIWGADLRVANVGVNLPAYQRVNTSTDYDSTGFPIYIKPNGSNQFMQTNSINFSSTDKMTVWQGVRKLSDAQSAIAELSVNVNANNGSFGLFTGFPVLANYQFYSRGTSAPAGGSSIAITSPTTNVLTGLGDISGDLMTLRVNGAQVATNTSDQGTGNYGNYPAYFYARAGTSLFFNGHDYGSIARGAASTAAQITTGENYINNLTKAYAP